jgi:hypothetical protein
MKKAKGAKSLEDKIREAVKGMKCPVHMKEPKITVNQETETAELECCCPSFKGDVKVVVDKVIRAWKLHGEHLRARRDERF